MEDFKKQLEKYNSLLPTEGCLSTTEAERRAGLFLEAMALVSDIKHQFSGERIKCLSIQTATMAKKLSEGTAKTVTENKLVAESSEEYTGVREAYESIDDDCTYLKACYDIYLNAHVFYRHMAKGEAY